MMLLRQARRRTAVRNAEYRRKQSVSTSTTNRGGLTLLWCCSDLLQRQGSTLKDFGGECRGREHGHRSYGDCSQCSHRHPPKRRIPASSSATVALLPNQWCRPVLTTVARRHLSRQNDLPDPADAITPLAPIEVLAVDAARGG
jgi:hypothetical protein